MRTRHANFLHRAPSFLNGAMILLLAMKGVARGEMSQADIARYFGVDREPEKQEGDWPRHFRVGAMVGMNIKADFKVSGNFAVTGSNPGAPGQTGLDHFYDDGYVRIDDTGNAGGRTSFWGYDSRSAQYDAGAQTLTFHSTSAFEATGSASADAAHSAGFDLAYGGHLFRIKRALVGWEFGFGLLPVKVKENQTLAATAIRSTYQFSTVGANMPDSETYDGSFNSDGYPTINDIATLIGTETNSTATVSGARELDVTLYSFRLGPTLHLELNRNWAVSASAGGAMSLVRGDLKWNETVTVSGGSGSASNRGSLSGSEIAYGWYAAGTLLYHADERGDFYLSAQYMPLGEATFGNASRSARLDLSGGWFISAGINWPF